MVSERCQSTHRSGVTRSSIQSKAIELVPTQERSGVKLYIVIARGNMRLNSNTLLLECTRSMAHCEVY